MSHWQPLQKGDIVDVVAPGYGAGAEHVKLGAEFLRSLGLVPRIPADLMGEHLLCANTDEKRLHHLKAALLAPDSKAVWALKGGYGTTVLMPELLKLKAPKQPKLLIGFSDISAVHLLVNNNWGWPSLHAPVLWQVVADKIAPESIEKLKQVMFGEVKDVRYELVILNEVKDLKQQEILRSAQNDIVITGGNMAILQTSLGTDWQADTKGKILFLEEVDERPYRVARMFAHFRQAGILDKPAAVILGDFTIEKPFDTQMESVLREFAASCSFPVYRLKGIGHEARNDPLPLGTKATIEGTSLRTATGAA